MEQLLKHILHVVGIHSPFPSTPTSTASSPLSAGAFGAQPARPLTKPAPKTALAPATKPRRLTDGVISLISFPSPYLKIAADRIFRSSWRFNDATPFNRNKIRAKNARYQAPNGAMHDYENISRELDTARFKCRISPGKNLYPHRALPHSEPCPDRSHSTIHYYDTKRPGIILSREQCESLLGRLKCLAAKQKGELDNQAPLYDNGNETDRNKRLPYFFLKSDSTLLNPSLNALGAITRPPFSFTLS